jgi:hypothetical protein
MQAENMRLMEELKDVREQNELKKSVIDRQKSEITILREDNQQLNVKNGKFANDFKVISVTVQQIEVMQQEILNLKKENDSHRQELKAKMYKLHTADAMKQQLLQNFQLLKHSSTEKQKVLSEKITKLQDALQNAIEILEKGT